MLKIKNFSYTQSAQNHRTKAFDCERRLPRYALWPETPNGGYDTKANIEDPPRAFFRFMFIPLIHHSNSMLTLP